jgi:predicted AlkP superfamily phosphohydrolase/phosphomutase
LTAKPSASRKVMAIGLDGLTLKVLLPLVEAGALPTFARLLQSGAHGVLRSVTNMTTAPTWASFATGCRPSKHGILQDFHHQTDAYLLRPTNGGDCRVPTFWQVASEAGLTSIVLNVPMSYPAQPMRGVLLAGVDAPHEHAPGFDYPPGIYRAQKRSIGDYVIDCGLASYIQSGQLSDGEAAVERETESHTRAAEHFMQQMHWDLMAIVYSLPDLWQHYYWHALQRQPDVKGRALIEGGYRLLDQHLSRLLHYLPKDGLVIICSDHGFGPLCSTRDHLNNWLAQQGLLQYREASRDRPLRRLAAAMLAQVRRRVHMRLRQQVLASVPALRRMVDTQLRIGSIDWGNTRVYAAVEHQELWVNLAGRQPAGCVPPSDYEELCEQLCARLLSWHDAHSGLPYIRAVVREPYGEMDIPEDSSAPSKGCLPPDLLLEWNAEAAPNGLHPFVSGDHTPDGTLIAAGAGVRPQRLHGCSLPDVAPLILHALGLPVPEYMDGCVPEGLFDSRTG